jgi:hypothetical protein
VLFIDAMTMSKSFLATLISQVTTLCATKMNNFNAQPGFLEENGRLSSPGRLKTGQA